MRVILLIIFFLTSPILGQQGEVLKILFVGNSYTYYWNLPLAVSLMAKSQGKTIISRQSTIGGSNLEQHWKGENQTLTRQLIEQEDWDYVVFQNHSLSAINEPESFFEYGNKFARLVQSKGAQAVFYMTWAREDNLSEQRIISKAYRKLAKQSDSYLVPVGEIWMRSMQLYPEFSLYDPDGSHPSDNGTYLNSLAFSKFFTGQSVQSVPEELITADGNGEPLYIAIMLTEEANALRSIVDTFKYPTLGSE